MQNFLQQQGKWAIPWALGLSLIVLIADYATGPYISFPVLYVFPVAWVAWFRPSQLATLLAAILCVIRLGLSIHWLLITRFDLSIILLNYLIDFGVLFLVAVLITRVARQQRALETRVQNLEGILPVCSFCKKIRNDEDKWESLETYIGHHSKAQFSHSVCPDCQHQHYAQFCDPETEKPKVPAAPAK